jgi:predicted transcriptional regulator
MTKLGVSFHQLSKADCTFMRSEIASFVHQNEVMSFKEQWHLHSRLLEFKLELEKQNRKDMLLNAIRATGFNIEVLPSCGELFVETGVMSSCFDTKVCTKQQPFLQAIDPTLFEYLDSGENRFEIIATHIVNEQRAIAKIDAIIEDALYRELNGYDYSVEFLRRWVKQLVRKHKSQSVNGTTLISIISMLCRKYLATLKDLKTEESAFSSRMLQILEMSIQTKCPLISKKILPLRDQLQDAKINDIIQNFCSTTHRYCSKHLTVCLEYAVSDIASQFRQNESQKYLINELRKLMPNFEAKDQLISKGSIERFHSATRLGMWIHVPLNAMRIYREECLVNYLRRLDPDFSPSHLLERSKQVFRQFILSNSQLNAQSDPLIWPVNRELTDCVDQIQKDEKHRKARTAIAKAILTQFKMDLNDDSRIQFLVLFALM